VLDEPPFEKAAQDKNSKQRERRQLDFQRKFTLHLMICTKGGLLL